MPRLLVALLAVAAVLAGCGGGATAPGDAAFLAPEGARALVEIDGDLDSDQWQTARDLLGRFPDGERVLSELRERDDALGDRIVVVALSERDVVALTQPDDPAELQRLLDEHDAVSREIEGWTAAAESADVLDRYEQALERGTLEGNERYEAARDAFPGEALATAYVRGDEGIGEWVALALTAEDNGVRLAGRLRATEETQARPVDAALLGEVPGNSLAVIAFGSGSAPENLPNPFGVDLRPILQLVSGGGVLWARPGLPVPEVTAMLPGGDPEALDGIVRTLTGAEPHEGELEGRPARTVRVGDIVIRYAEVDGRLVVTTATAPGSGGGLEDDPDFRDAREAAEMPDETNGFLYVNLQRIVPLLGFAGAPDEVSRNLRPIASVLAWSSGEGRDQDLALFVEIR